MSLQNSMNFPPVGFLVWLNTSVPNKTGNGIVTAVFDTVYFDNTSSFDLELSMFTAPVSGFYQFSAGCGISNITTGNSMSVQLDGYLTPGNVVNPSVSKDANGQISSVVSVCQYLNAGGGVQVQIRSEGEAADTQTLVGASAYSPTYFSGCLVAPYEQILP